MCIDMPIVFESLADVVIVVELITAHLEYIGHSDEPIITDTDGSIRDYSICRVTFITPWSEEGC